MKDFLTRCSFSFRTSLNRCLWWFWSWWQIEKDGCCLFCMLTNRELLARLPPHPPHCLHSVCHVLINRKPPSVLAQVKSGIQGPQGAWERWRGWELDGSFWLQLFVLMAINEDHTTFAKLDAHIDIYTQSSLRPVYESRHTWCCKHFKDAQIVHCTCMPFASNLIMQ